MRPKHYGLKDLDTKTESELTEEDKASGRYVKLSRAQRRKYAAMINSKRKQDAKKTRQKIAEITRIAEGLGTSSEAPSETVCENQTSEQGSFGKRS